MSKNNNKDIRVDHSVNVDTWIMFIWYPIRLLKWRSDDLLYILVTRIYVTLPDRVFAGIFHGFMYIQTPRSPCSVVRQCIACWNFYMNETSIEKWETSWIFIFVQKLLNFAFFPLPLTLPFIISVAFPQIDIYDR